MILTRLQGFWYTVPWFTCTHRLIADNRTLCGTFISKKDTKRTGTRGTIKPKCSDCLAMLPGGDIDLNDFVKKEN